MSVKRTALAAAFFLALVTLPTTTRFGPDLSFTTGGDDGGHGAGAGTGGNNDGPAAGRAGSGNGGAGRGGGNWGGSARGACACARNAATRPTTITGRPAGRSQLRAG